ncbi:MAG: ubiquitin [Oscillospiraceae bacterium]|nr:ubiquitin [Oscillospiraceae bacterium]
MTELEKVEKLREKANVSFAEAKEALDNANGDILDALIYLEQQGKATIPAGGGCFSGVDAPAGDYQYSQNWEAHNKRRGETFSEMMKRFGRFLLKMFNKGNTNFLDATKGDSLMFSCPVTAAVVLLLFFFWVTVPLFIFSLFFGFRYRFRGEDLGKDSINAVMDGAANAVDDVKNSFAESANRADNGR